ncbi:MAG TPA: glycosyl hydrolase [Trebonia sp.]|nr:glycosyl hydrolase [Trebonia sp.]
MKRLAAALVGVTVGVFLLVHIVWAAPSAQTAQGAGAISASLPPPDPAKLPASHGLIVGAAATSMAAFTAAVGVRPSILEHYAHPGDSFSAGFAGTAEPLIQIEPSKTPLAGFVAGTYDGWLRSYARAVVAYKKPVILGFGPEMNGTWSSWGYKHVQPAVYVAAWRHVVSVFRAAGARNVTWIWTVNVTHTGWDIASPDAWWPGAAWVDLVGVDGYYYASSQDFADLFALVLADIHRLTSKPVLISETAAAPVASKPAKIADVFAGAHKAGLLGLVWFDLPGVKDWRLEDDPAAVAAFRGAAGQYSS